MAPEPTCAAIVCPWPSLCDTFTLQIVAKGDTALEESKNVGIVPAYCDHSPGARRGAVLARHAPVRSTMRTTTRSSALIKGGWTITDDPYILVYKGLRLYADLGAEQAIAAE